MILFYIPAFFVVFQLQNLQVIITLFSIHKFCSILQLVDKTVELAAEYEVFEKMSFYSKFEQDVKCYFTANQIVTVLVW